MLTRSAPSSLWLQAARRYSYPSLQGEFTTDVAVVGAGITGLTTALLLQRAGKQVAVLEANQIASGTSGESSAHVTEVIDLPYSELASRFGESRGESWVRLNREALGTIRRFVEELRIGCDFQQLSGYRFTESAAQVSELEAEAETARRLGLTCFVARSSPLPFPIQAAIVFENQASFHPLRYLEGLGAELVRRGGRIFESTRVGDIEEDDFVRLSTADGRVHARKAVLATHTAIGRNAVQTELRACRSYVIAARLQGDPPFGLFWDTSQPYHYIRECRSPEGPLILAGGGDHPTGREVDPERSFGEVEGFLRGHFRVESLRSCWSSQLYEPADGLPYIGKSPFSEHTYIATGYGGTGLVQGTGAGIILAGEIIGQRHPAAEVCEPARIKPSAALQALVSTSVDRAPARDRLRAGSAQSTAEIPTGQGRIVEVDGETLAVYRDADGALHAFSPACRHMGCFVRWNRVEESWDCPCHGGRYEPTGRVLSGPPLEALEPRTLRILP